MGHSHVTIPKPQSYLSGKLRKVDNFEQDELGSMKSNTCVASPKRYQTSPAGTLAVQIKKYTVFVGS